MTHQNRNASTERSPAHDSTDQPDEADSMEGLNYERVSPEEAFELLGHETRLKILQVLVKEEGGPVSFSKLRDRVDIRDPSQFNYHLKKLDGSFVRKMDDGYYVRHAGVHVIRTIVTGTFTDQPRITPFRTGGTCVDCGDPLVAHYEYGLMFVKCSECERTHSMGMFPPGALAGRSPEEALAAYNRWQRRFIALVVAGICGICGGQMTRSSGDATDLPTKLHTVEPSDFLLYDYNVRYQCEQCDVWSLFSPGFHLLTDPDVIGIYRDHGINLAQEPYWELDWCIGVEHTTVISDDPLRIEVIVPFEDEELRVTLNEEFTVVDTERRSPQVDHA